MKIVRASLESNEDRKKSVESENLLNDLVEVSEYQKHLFKKHLVVRYMWVSNLVAHKLRKTICIFASLIFYQNSSFILIDSMNSFCDSNCMFHCQRSLLICYWIGSLAHFVGYFGTPLLIWKPYTLLNWKHIRKK